MKTYWVSPSHTEEFNLADVVGATKESSLHMCCILPCHTQITQTQHETIMIITHKVSIKS